ncbi:hypothetical protein PINS_up009882 [Pythium insidiosum]|nr:hypothetical protein PINS_up009882 [Pythium insidiosum]
MTMMEQENETTYTKESDTLARMHENDAVLDPHFLPANAAALVQSLLQLSVAQRDILERELNRSGEDALLVLSLNPMWHGCDVDASAVCDAIATFGMTGGARRDASNSDCHRWIFHFDSYQDIGLCRRGIRAMHPQAFAHSRAGIEAIANAGGFDKALLRAEPLAFAAVVIKIGVRQDDAGEYPFFFQ